MTHTQIYPKILKISKNLPILKPNKDKFKIDSYRPINILHPVDKIYQEHVKNNLIDFLDYNKILLNLHQGGLKKHGTDTALTIVLDELYRQKENDNISCILQTDLSAAYDTIDHKILLDKLDYYGVRGPSLNLLDSYLTNRCQFTSIDTYDSDLVDSLDCSVIQGSKLSSLLYIIYTNEVPYLHKFLTDINLNDQYNKFTNYKFNDLLDNIKNFVIDHLTVNYIDDSTNIISCDNATRLIKYLTCYYGLVKIYYDINKLTINSDKTDLVVSCKNKFRQASDTIKFTADTYLVQQKESTKILGFIITNTLNHDKHLNSIISRINLRLNTLKYINKYMNNKVRILVTNSLVLSILKYVMPLLVNLNAKQLNIVCLS